MSLPASSELAALNLQPSDSDSFPANMNAATNQQEPVKYLHIHDFIPFTYKRTVYIFICAASASSQSGLYKNRLQSRRWLLKRVKGRSFE